VVFNGQELNAEGDGHFTVTLTEQSTNTIRLSISDPQQVPPADVVFRIKHRRAVAEDDGSTGSQAPSFTVNITDGQSVTGSDYTLEVVAQDARGNRIYSSGVRGSGITLTLNESPVYSSWEGAKTSYALKLNPGANTIVVLVVDAEGYSTRASYTLYCTPVEAGTQIGAITVSVDANVVGLGNLIAPVSESILEGENGVYPLARVLNANGFQYRYTGSAQTQFYLSHLLRANITTRNNLSVAEIPPELKQYLYDDGIALNDFYADSLGALDFSQGSGWMICINGTYPSYGLSDYRPRDGDVVQLRFTVAYGRDITGAYPVTW
jgi:hypothetical protein